jgi:transposase-like protein
MRWSPDFKFKLEAVKLVKEGGVSVAQAVRDL